MRADATASSNEPTRAFYDRIARVYDLIADSSEHRSREEGVRALDPGSGATVLEIGVGTGHALVDLARAVEPDGLVHGIDLSAGMLRVAGDRVRQEGVAARIGLALGDARRLPYADGNVDAAFMSFTLELFPVAEIPSVLAEVRRVLRPQGRLGIVSLVEPEERKTAVELYKWMHRHFPHIVDCQPIAARSLLAAAGYEAQSDHRRSIWGLPVDVLVVASG